MKQTHTNPSSPAQSNLGQRLKYAIQYSGKTMTRVCHEAGISLTTYQRYTHEEVSPSLINIQRLAEATGVDFTWLATGEGEIQAFSADEKQRLLIRDLINESLILIEQAEKKQRKTVSSKVKANIISDLVMDALKEETKHVDETNVIRFLRYAGGAE